MNNDEPIAFFITWTVYGTFLQGDERGWRKRRQGNQIPQPKLATWRRDRLKHPIQLLDVTHQLVVETEIERLAAFRGWHIWTKNARTNHVHVVVAASGYAGNKEISSKQTARAYCEIIAQSLSGVPFGPLEAIGNASTMRTNWTKLCCT